MFCTPLFLKDRAADYRENLLRDGGLADAGAQFRFGDGRAFDELLEQLVVGLGDRLDHLVVIFLGLLEQVRRNLDVVVLGAQRLVPPDARLHRDQIHDALELVFGADRDLDRHRASCRRSTMVCTER